MGRGLVVERKPDDRMGPHQSRRRIHGNTAPLERTFNFSDLSLSGKPEGHFERFQASQRSLSIKLEPSTVIVRLREGTNDGPFLPGQWVSGYTFLPGGRFAMSNSVGLCIYDGQTGTMLHKFEGKPGGNELCVSPDGRYLLSGGVDGILRILALDGRGPMLSLFSAENDWVAWTPEGYYAASPGGEQLMGWQVNNGPYAMGTFYPASQFRKTLYRPDVIKRLLGGGSLDKALAGADAATGRDGKRTDVARILPPKVAITTPSDAKVDLDGNTLEIKAVASSVGDHPVTTLRLLIDGRPAPEGLKSFTEPKLGEVRVSWTVEVPPGNHRLTVQASNAVSKAVSDPVEVVTANNDNPVATAASLYVLAVGINDYPEKRLKLDCAAPDAQALRQAFVTNSSKLFRVVEVKLLLNGEATRANMLEGLQWLAGKARPGDVVVVFYAGHGDCKIEDQFYLVPVDANLRNLSATGISGEALKP